MQKNYYAHSPGHPAHISVGAVLVNGAGEICTHYFKENPLRGLKTTPASYSSQPESFYLLMRETVEMGERLEDAVQRGLKEEFGATGTIRTYVCSTTVRVPEDQQSFFQKTTLYFLVDLNSIDPAQRSPDDAEAGSEVTWVEPRALIEHMKSQGTRFGIADVDESEVIEKALAYLHR